MTLPFGYRSVAPGRYGGELPTKADFETARIAILPLPLDRTGSGAGTLRYGPREILLASSRLEVWDEETECDVSTMGICTLPEMEFPFASLEEVTTEIRRVASEIISRDKFPVFLGGEHTITGPIVAAMAQRHSGLSVLQIDARADLRDAHMGTPHNRACAMRRALEYARATQVGIRSLSPEEASAAPILPTEIFYDHNMRLDEHWIERVVDSLSETVYVTIDVGGLDPAIMPATSAPEPGGLSWYETLALLRRVSESRNVVGFDLVELTPIPGLVAPNSLCSRLIYKILSYKFAEQVRR
jgi:agmatinase